MHYITLVLTSPIFLRPISSHRQSLTETPTGLLEPFPTWCFYLAPVFVLMGGGPWATAALVFATVHDEVAPPQRYAVVVSLHPKDPTQVNCC
jgi:hypothetical protein